MKVINKINVTKTIILLLSICLSSISCMSFSEPEYLMSQHAHQICLQYGAKPGTRLFYRCMKSQMRKNQYNNAKSNCSSPKDQLSIANQCNQSAFVGSPNYWQSVADCKIKLTMQCEHQASNEYLNRNDAKKFNLTVHDYNHNYYGK